ncbi:TetR/AcrR family transcriptional regulator [Actinokineospora iranica]|uniref:DNA-binding transcriptional regulator, AcrR family n=1 Tax=Actinokineospora iranica TaxID=1271860 RepID=A0A1G6SSH0_9PSEU|nr:TetR/AcrR family transcriptional regulator [Actinokineospora iranica]SDD19581.1 DNA-binding transcriptional regulator, AcrR family [Actinokineospora iranica]
MPRPKTHDEALRTRLLDRAGELLSSEGAAALSLRKLAADVGTSTTAVYSLFGGKPALVRALYMEAFRRLGTRLQAVQPTGDPAEDLTRLGIAYRDSALADPHLYGIMFGGHPGFEPDEEATAQARAALEPLLNVIAAGARAGVFPDTTHTMAMGCWGIVHGLVSLELCGNLPPDMDVAATYERALRANTSGWRR